MIGFGKYTKMAKPVPITSLTDNRLVKINPQEDGFFDAVINFKSTNCYINAFIEAIFEVKAARLETFYKPIYDPSEDGGIIAYENDKEPAVGHPYDWWVKTASKKIFAVEGRHWYLATEYQYYAFLVWLINQLVKRCGSVEAALNMVVLDSKELGHYFDSPKANNLELTSLRLEPTGSRCVCGFYDLANTSKILVCSNKEAGGIWLGGGNFFDIGRKRPLAYLCHQDTYSAHPYNSVGMLVLY